MFKIQNSFISTLLSKSATITEVHDNIKKEQYRNNPDFVNCNENIQLLESEILRKCSIIDLLCVGESFSSYDIIYTKIDI